MIFLVRLLHLSFIYIATYASVIEDEERIRSNRNNLKNRKQPEVQMLDDDTNLLYLKTNSGTQFLSTGFVKDSDGNAYDLSKLQPYHEIFSESYFTRSRDGMQVTDVTSRETMPVSVFRANYDGGTMIQVEKDVNGEILYCEIRRPRGESDMFLVRSSVELKSPQDTDHDDDPEFLPLPLPTKMILAEGTDNDNTNATAPIASGGNEIVNYDAASAEPWPAFLALTEDDPGPAFIAFTEDDVDKDFIATNFHYGETTATSEGVDDESNNAQVGQEDRGFEFLSLFAEEQKLPDFYYARGDGTSIECTFFKIVNLAIVYDAEFCRMYGSFERARSRILTIVASASVLYERDMCVKLKLTKIYTPETSLESCRWEEAGSSQAPTFFQSFPRDVVCAYRDNNTFLDAFSKWMDNARSNMGIDDESAVHIFTGYPPQGTVGCAWLGTLCTNSYAYGVEYLSFTSNIQKQGLVLAHELAHNLNASHLPLKDTYRYVMEPSLSQAVDGFSQISIEQILSFLDAPTTQCDDVELQKRFTPAPAPSPSPPSPTMETDMCTIQQGTSALSPICVRASYETDQYACVDTSLLTPAQLSGSSLACTFSPYVTSRILSCDGEFNSGEVINQGKKAKKKTGDRRGLRKNKSNDDKEDGPPKAIETDNDCSETCVMVSNFVCFLANVDEDEKNYQLTYESSAPGFPSATFTTNIRILSNNAREYWDETVATCHDTFTNCVY